MNLQRREHRALAVATVAGAAMTYLLFVGQAGRHEVLAAAIVVILASAYAFGVFRAARPALLARPAFSREFLRGVAAIPTDTFLVGRALLRAVRTRPDGAVGVIERQAFRRGEDAEDVGWRAVAGLGVSIAPNGYLIDLADGDALIHRLVAAEAPR